MYNSPTSLPSTCSQLPCHLRGADWPLFLISLPGVPEVYLGRGADAGYHASSPLPASPPAAAYRRSPVDPARLSLGPHLQPRYGGRNGVDLCISLPESQIILFFPQRRRGSRKGTSDCHPPRVEGLRLGAATLESWANSWRKGSYL